jgi:hypothetical protein
MTEVAETIKKRTKEYALKVENRIKRIANSLGSTYWDLAELISDVHDKCLWQILGHESEREYQESLLISRSSWFEKRRIWDEWCSPAIQNEKITRAQLKRMQSQNVKQLMRLDKKRMFDDKWITWALTLKEGELEEKVDHVLVNQEDPNEESSDDSRAILKVEMSKTQKKFILESMKVFAEVQEPPIPLEDEGRILELMVADARSGLPTAEELRERRAIPVVQ